MLENTNVKTLDRVVVRFAGDSGDGMQLAGNIFSNVSAGEGNQISTFPDYPAEIRAPQGSLSGVSGFQVHIGRGVHTPGDQADVLVAMNPAALKTNLQFLKSSGIIICDVDKFQKADLEKAQFATDDPVKELGIDPRRITWRRCVDMNDRQLRFVVDGLGGKVNGTPREDGYDITVASEIMAVLCLASDINDLKARLARLVVGYTYPGKPVTAGDLHAQGAMAALLKDALKPNLVQTLEHTPAFVHGGPFANIAHGCNSVTATKIALKLGDYAITEAGFGADLGAEKFLDIKCRMAGLKPSCVVLVATARALKYNGGVPKAETGKENLEALEKGLPNLLQHVSNITTVYKLPCVVAINRFPTDTEAELKLIETKCKELGVNVALSEVWGKGGEGGVELAKEVIRLCEQPNDFTFSYELNCSIKEKIEAIAKKIYHADGVNFTANAEKQIKTLTELGYDHMPICMAKTQYSFTDDQTKLGAPRDFTITVRNVKVSAGAGFLVALTGEIMTMPGLPKVPAAERIDVDETGKISGLF